MFTPSNPECAYPNLHRVPDIGNVRFYYINYRREFSFFNQYPLGGISILYSIHQFLIVLSLTSYSLHNSQAGFSHICAPSCCPSYTTSPVCYTFKKQDREGLNLSPMAVWSGGEIRDSLCDIILCRFYTTPHKQG